MNRPSELWTDQVLHAEGLEDRGDLSAAADEYERLTAEAPSPGAKRWITHERAELEEKRGDTDRALGLYKENYEAPLVDSYGAKGLYRTARILQEQGDSEEAFRLKFRVLLHYANEIAAENALNDIVEDLEKRAPLTAQRTLQKLYAPLAQTYLADNVLFLEARICHESLKDSDCALQRYRTIYVDHPDSGLADDALWEIAMIYKERGMWPQAVDALDVMANNTETSWFVGSYDSKWVDDAVLELGMIHLLFYKDYDAAVGYFMRYADDFQYSLLADDALWVAADARRLQGRDDLHFHQLRLLLNRFPESRYAPKARARLGIVDEAP